MSALCCQSVYVQDFDVNDAKTSVESDQRDGRTSLLLGVEHPTGTAATSEVPSEAADSQPNRGTTITGWTANGGVSGELALQGANESSPRRPVRRVHRSVEAGLQPVQTRYAKCWGECMCARTHAWVC